MTTITETATVVLPEAKTATKGIKAKVDRLRELRAQKSVIEAETKTLSAEIIEFAGLSKLIMWGKTRLATIVSSTNTSCDFAALEQGWPEAYAACVKKSGYKQVR